MTLRSTLRGLAGLGGVGLVAVATAQTPENKRPDQAG